MRAVPRNRNRVDCSTADPATLLDECCRSKQVPSSSRWKSDEIFDQQPLESRALRVWKACLQGLVREARL
jgi:hypothetical protein